MPPLSIPPPAPAPSPPHPTNQPTCSELDPTSITVSREGSDLARWVSIANGEARAGPNGHSSSKARTSYLARGRDQEPLAKEAGLGGLEGLQTWAGGD